MDSRNDSALRRWLSIGPLGDIDDITDYIIKSWVWKFIIWILLEKIYELKLGKLQKMYLANILNIQLLISIKKSEKIYQVHNEIDMLHKIAYRIYFSLCLRLSFWLLAIWVVWNIGIKIAQISIVWFSTPYNSSLQ